VEGAGISEGTQSAAVRLCSKAVNHFEEKIILRLTSERNITLE
jgi:hypothetical protein